MFQVSVTCYILLYFLVSGYSKGEISKVIEYMTLAIIPFIILNGFLLFLGALEVNVLKPDLENH